MLHAAWLVARGSWPVVGSAQVTPVRTALRDLGSRVQQLEKALDEEEIRPELASASAAGHNRMGMDDAREAFR